MLASCDVRTLYLRNVPDDVAVKLERLAADSGMSLSGFAVRELVEISRRADNAALLDALPDLDIETAVVVASVDDARQRR